MPPLPVGAAWDQNTSKWGVNPNGTATALAAARKKAANEKAAKAQAARKQAAVRTAAAKKTAKRNAKTGASAFNKWLASQDPGGAAPSMTVNPLTGMPADTELTAFPDIGDIPDGSGVANTTSPAFKSGRASLLDPQAFAKLRGEASYQPLIDSLGVQQKRLEMGKGTALGMIDQAGAAGSAAALAGADKINAGTAQTNQGLTDLAARMAAAAGGDPTAAAAIAGTTGDAAASASKFGAIAAGSQADSAAAAARDAATQKLAYTSENDRLIGDLSMRRGEAQTQGKQAQGQAIMDALGFNDSMKTSQLGRDTAKQNAWLAAALAGPEITRANLGNEATRQNLKLNVHNTEVNDWTNITREKRADYAEKWNKYLGKQQAGQIIDEFKKGNTPAVELALADPQARSAVMSDVLGSQMTENGPTMPPARMAKYIQSQLRKSYGTSSPKARTKLASIFMEQVIGQWAAHHPSDTHTWVIGKDGVTPRRVKKT